MAMSPATLASNILLGFTSAGFIGKDSPVFANIVGTGAMAEIIGKGFDTIDTGTAPGVGVGSGLGLTGIVGAVISLAIQTEIVAALGNPPTDDMISMSDAVGDAVELEVALATLVTSHNPVAVGTAIITPSSIKVVGADVGDSIDSTGAGSGFVGDDWPTIANAMGKAIGDGFLTANGAITIVGAPTVPTSPVVGAPNTVSPAGVLT